MGEAHRFANIVSTGILSPLVLWATLFAGLPSTKAQLAPDNITPNATTVYVALSGNGGKTVEELKREDFNVVEKGRPMEILGVSKATDSALLIGTMIDISGSARTEHRRDYLQVLNYFLARTIRGRASASLVGFERSTFHLTSMTGSLAELEAGLKEIAGDEPKGSTALYDCLLSASKAFFHDAKGRRIVLVMSDFQDNASLHKLDETIGRIQEAGVAVFPLVQAEQGPGAAKSWKDRWKVAERIAGKTGGVAYSFGSADELDVALTKI